MPQERWSNRTVSQIDGMPVAYSSGQVGLLNYACCLNFDHFFLLPPLSPSLQPEWDGDVHVRRAQHKSIRVIMGNTTWMCSASLHTQTHIHWSAACAQTQCDDATPISCMNTITWFYISFVVVVDVIARTVFTFSILYMSFFACRRFIVTEWTYWNFIKHDCVVLHSLLSAFGTMQFASIENDNCDASNSSEMRWTEKECEFIIRLFAAAIEMP